MRMNEAELCIKAKTASKNAYAPYSGFQVGAAVETDRGIFFGCNVENVSFGISICAERNAVSSAIASGARRIRLVAVYNGKKIPYPCGACLQVISEFASPGAQVIVFTDRKNERYRLVQLLPKAFRF